MTSESSIDLKEVIFINERCKRDYFELPDDVGESADEALTCLQNGGELPRKMTDKLSGKLAGIEEVKIPYNTDTYRIYIHRHSPYCVMVLDAGMKKSHEKSEIPKEQKERLEERLKSSKTYCKNFEGELRDAYLERMKLRDEQKA